MGLGTPTARYPGHLAVGAPRNTARYTSRNLFKKRNHEALFCLRKTYTCHVLGFLRHARICYGRSPQLWLLTPLIWLVVRLALQAPHVCRGAPAWDHLNHDMNPTQLSRFEAGREDELATRLKPQRLKPHKAKNLTTRLKPRDLNHEA